MSYRYRLKPTSEQQAVMEVHCRHARYVYNIALEQRSAWRPGRKGISATRQMRELAEARHEFQWLAAGSSAVQQQALRDLDRAFTNFFEERKAARLEHREPRVGYPAFKKEKRHDGSFCVRDVRLRSTSDKWGFILIPKAGWVRFRLTATLPVKLGMGRVTRDRAGRWHVIILVAPLPMERQPTGFSVGIDRGVANTVATSDGEVSHAPGLRRKELERVRRLQQSLARQRTGSQRHENTKRALGRLLSRVADRRTDWVSQTTSRLVRRYDVIAVERLRVLNMTRSAKGTVLRPGRNVRQKAALNRAILGQCWGLLVRRLKQKAAQGGVIVIEVDPRYTSRTCHVCGHEAAENRRRQALFRCVSCRNVQHADTHAAENILERGMALLGDLAPAAGSAVAARGHLCRARGRSANDPWRQAESLSRESLPLPQWGEGQMRACVSPTLQHMGKAVSQQPLGDLQELSDDD